MTDHWQAPDPWAMPAPSPYIVPWRRLSPLMLLVHPFREGARLIPFLVLAVISGSRNGGGELWAVVGTTILVGASMVRWFTTSFQITPEKLELRSGLLRRSTTTVPIDRIRTVDVTQHALHRILGLARVSIGTGTNDEHNSKLVLDGLAAQEATALRGELLHGHRGAATPPMPVGFQPAPPVYAPPTYAPPTYAPPTYAPPTYAQPQFAEPEQEQELVRLDPAWLRYAPLSLTGLASAFAFLLLIANAANQSSSRDQRNGFFLSIGWHLHSPDSWISVLVIVVVLLAVLLLICLTGYVLAFWNFRLTRHSGGTLQVRRGLITLRTTSIEERRLRGVEVSAPLLLRSGRGARLIAVATGLRVGRGAERGGTELMPPAPLTVVAALAKQILSIHGRASTPAVGGSLLRHPSVARRRRLTRAVVPTVVLALALALAGVWGLVGGLVLVVLAVLLGLDRYRALGHAVIGSLFISQYGSLVRRRVVLESEAIIGWNLRRTFFQRRGGVATLTATTAAGRQSYPITDVGPQEATAVIRAATPGLLEPFLPRAAAPEASVLPE